MQSYVNRVETGLNALKHGKLVILTDDVDRENEGDLIFPAECITPDIMNFIIRHSSGIVCLSLLEEQLQKLGLPLMVAPQENTSTHGTPFTISIDAKEGISTGVSALDRVKTIQIAIQEQVNSQSLTKPGHIFPLRANSNGVLARAGHTEGALDMVRIAGFKPAAVLCEIMNPDGTMARDKQLTTFARKHGIPILSIADIISYRLAREDLITDTTSTVLPIASYGLFNITVVREKITNKEHVILEKENPAQKKLPLVRIHSACLTGDVFQSLRCDCYAQFHYALQKISKEGGMLIRLDQEGRGVGLFNKIRAYALQEQGIDTVEANQQLGLSIDAREYHIAANILRNRHLQRIRLLTNNPLKVDALKKYGISQITRSAMPVFCNSYNEKYLQTKKEKLQHHIEHEFLSRTSEASK